MAKEKKQQSHSSEAPTLGCILLCDDVVISQARQKHTLVGVIGGIAVKSLPATVGGYCAYIRFSNMYPGQKVLIRLEHAATADICFEVQADFSTQSDPLGVYTIVLPIGAFEIRHSGRYLFTAIHDGIPIASSPITVKCIEEEA